MIGKIRQKTIDIYIKKLNPKRIGNLTSVLFRFDNHGKIILTNNIIYWGSANYSDESKINYECGTISYDKELIEFVHNIVIPSIIQDAMNYYKRDYVSYVASIYSAMSLLHNMYQEIYDASYGLHEDYDTNFETARYYNYHENHLSWTLLEQLMETVIEFQSLLDGILDEIEDSDWEEYHKLDQFIEDFRKSTENENDNICTVCYDLEELSQFDIGNVSNSILSTKYGNLAYDEDLDYYAQLALEESMEMKERLIKKSKESIVVLIGSIEKYINMLRRFANELVNLSQINEGIDNTKQS